MIDIYGNIEDVKARLIAQVDQLHADFLLSQTGNQTEAEMLTWPSKMLAVLLTSENTTAVDQIKSALSNMLNAEATRTNKSRADLDQAIANSVSAFCALVGAGGGYKKFAKAAISGVDAQSSDEVEAVAEQLRQQAGL